MVCIYDGMIVKSIFLSLPASYLSTVSYYLLLLPLIPRSVNALVETIYFSLFILLSEICGLYLI